MLGSRMWLPTQRAQPLFLQSLPRKPLISVLASDSGGEGIVLTHSVRSYLQPFIPTPAFLSREFRIILPISKICGCDSGLNSFAGRSAQAPLGPVASRVCLVMRVPSNQGVRGNRLTISPRQPGFHSHHALPEKSQKKILIKMSEDPFRRPADVAVALLSSCWTD